MTDYDKIFRLEDYIVKNLDPEMIEWVHRFAPGMYSREMIVPAGCMLTGSIHKSEHFSIFLEGVLLVPGEYGSKIIEAPQIEIAKPGTKRVGVALTDLRWITFHRTDATTLEEAEEELFTNDPSELPALLEYVPTGRIEYQEDYALAQRDRQDYLECQEPPELLEQLQQIPVVDMEVEGVEIKESKRDGKGLFATKDFDEGDIVAPAVLENQLICFSRYCNHSVDENAGPWMDEETNSTYIVARRPIRAGEEICMNYRETIQ